eukprot:TRINITY_DN6610_c0_g1_i3.p1 TRINITY_DN6610_c0_g1~~TRINITY_DN6610_c0_g1_i3.p1  ORF type:complete len:548 (+),score=128.74 TRINITY_DN6610_c0_g1_i3:56-1699(+)
MPPKKGKRAAKATAIISQPPAKVAATDDHPDSLELAELFGNGAEAWQPLLEATINAQVNAAEFLSKKRAPTIVPIREMTFQALKANPPNKWNVIIFGQNPYPRIESATGVAMLDNTFKEWSDKRFGSVTSMRCIMKAATMWKHNLPKATKVSELRTMFAQHQVVPPQEWFQAALAQGCLLLNAGLTASTDGSLSTSKHTTFWRPIVAKIVESILAAKHAANEGVVFAWWGSHAKALRKIVDKLSGQYPNCKIVQIDHCNPAAMGDAFCNGNHFENVNNALTTLGLKPIDWLPVKGWQKSVGIEAQDLAKMQQFVTSTVDLHKMYLERLQDVDEEMEALPAIEGVMDMPVPTFAEAAAALRKIIPSFATNTTVVDLCVQVGQAANDPTLTADEVAAIHLYTMNSAFYSRLNAALRNADRSKLSCFFPYLRLFLEAMRKIKGYRGPLWRGLRLDLTKLYQKGSIVTWWGVSSCSQDKAVAERFMGSKGTRMLFEVHSTTAIGIMPYSAFQEEAEYVLPPGTTLLVESVVKQASGKVIVKLVEQKEKLVN